MSKLSISVIRDPQRGADSLIHQPIVCDFENIHRASQCLAWELFDCLRRAGFSGEEIARGQRQIEETGSTVFESSDIDFEDVLNKCEQNRPTASPL